ncbi:hypothetical protein MVEN_00393400 [Mycena venus]|uniref:lytic cellulose monooxygenase (C4-dehydrogenating) n=1 Tax=Mycena venus TaxID=2733690 RepID=A0A8H7DAS7_9AGAR|nr:hypothetical protein MVEN_00393400 [Mycena venus]
MNLALVASLLATLTATRDVRPRVGHSPSEHQLPVTSVSDPNLTCGPNAQLAEDVADANPGDAVAVNWVSTEGPWFHNVGPMLTYLANCGSAPCSGFDASNAMWFKIQQVGRDATGGWAQAQLNTGAPATLNLPSNLAPGNYLLRHEIIALQNAEGSGTGAPTSGELVKLPGAYSATDPGILVDVYSNPNAPYTFPGPPIAAFVSGGDSAPPGNPPASSSVPSGISSGSPSHSTTPPGRPTDTSTAPSTSSTVCRLRRSILSSQSEPSRGAKRWHRALRNFRVFRK